MYLVLDTNILVSALWTPKGKPAEILSKVISKEFILCYDYRILDEYIDVLSRPKFGFRTSQIIDLLDFIKRDGIAVMPNSFPEVTFNDESDRKFYEVARTCNAPLISGNLKHYPAEPWIIYATDFYRMYIGS